MYQGRDHSLGRQSSERHLGGILPVRLTVGNRGLLSMADLPLIKETQPRVGGLGFRLQL